MVSPHLDKDNLTVCSSLVKPVSIMQLKHVNIPKKVSLHVQYPWKIVDIPKWYNVRLFTKHQVLKHNNDSNLNT